MDRVKIIKEELRHVVSTLNEVIEENKEPSALAKSSTLKLKIVVNRLLGILDDCFYDFEVE